MQIHPIIDPRLESGSAAGQMLFWDGTEWVHTETSELAWDDTSKILVASGLTVTGSSVLGLNSAVFKPAAGGDSTTFFQIKNAAGTIDVVTISTDGSAEALQINQTVDSKGLKICGFADRSNKNVQIYIDSLGRTHIETDGGNLILAPSGDNLVSVASHIKIGNNKLMRFGDDSDYGIVYSHADDTLQFVDGVTVNTNVRMALNSLGYIGFSEPDPETLLELTHAQPYITLHNETHENTDGGRESRIIFKGEQDAGGEETELAMLEVSHDGTGNDQLGKVVWGVNTGADVVDRMKLDSTGMVIYSADASDQIQIYHNNTIANIRWDDGVLNLQTNKGTNSDTVVQIIGKGTGVGVLRVSGGGGEFVFRTSTLSSGFQGEGTAIKLDIQHNANIPVNFFRNAGEGETQELQIYGYREGDSKRSLQIGVGVDADDTASFDGLSNYMFIGDLITKDFTHSDADDAGATSWTAKRERSGQEFADIFSITGSHDGDQDDELGKIVVSVNTGAELVEALRLDSDLLATFAGDITTTGIIDLNPAHTDSIRIIDITPTAAITTEDAHWDGFKIDGQHLDPSVAGVILHGVHVDFSDVLQDNSPDIRPFYIQTPANYTHEGARAAGRFEGNGKYVSILGHYGYGLRTDDGILQDYTIGADALATYTVHDIVINAENQHATSETHAMDVALSAGLEGTVVALGTHSEVDVIHQHVGTFNAITLDSLWIDPSYSAFADENIWAAEDDAFCVGHTAVFDEIELVFDTAATKDCFLRFYYWKELETPAWVRFYPEDDTRGGRQNGIIRFDGGGLTDWLSADPTGQGAGYWIKIERNRVSEPGTVNLASHKYLVAISYSWDKDGNLSVNSITIADGGGEITNLDGGKSDSDYTVIDMSPIDGGDST